MRKKEKERSHKEKRKRKEIIQKKMKNENKKVRK